MMYVWETADIYLSCDIINDKLTFNHPPGTLINDPNSYPGMNPYGNLGTLYIFLFEEYLFTLIIYIYFNINIFNFWIPIHFNDSILPPSEQPPHQPIVPVMVDLCPIAFDPWANQDADYSGSSMVSKDGKIISWCRCGGVWVVVWVGC